MLPRRASAPVKTPASVPKGRSPSRSLRVPHTCRENSWTRTSRHHPGYSAAIVAAQGVVIIAQGFPAFRAVDHPRGFDNFFVGEECLVPSSIIGREFQKEIQLVFGGNH